MKSQNIATSIAKSQSIVTSIAKSQKYCNKYCRISKELQYLYVKSQKYCNKYCKISKYYNTLQYYWNYPWIGPWTASVTNEKTEQTPHEQIQTLICNCASFRWKKASEQTSKHHFKSQKS